MRLRRWYCKWCDREIVKGIVGWRHVTTFPFIPEALHIASPR